MRAPADGDTKGVTLAVGVAACDAAAGTVVRDGATLGVPGAAAGEPHATAIAQMRSNAGRRM